MHGKYVPIYDLQPSVGNYNYISPSSTVAGDVYLGDNINVDDNVVIRGDINVIRILGTVHIGANSVLRTVASLPTGEVAVVNIKNHVVIEPGCTLVSCEIGTTCYIGTKTVILEGAKISDEVMIGPNSVVPPGRFIPSGQLWAGNPVQFVRNLTGPEKHQIKVHAEWHKTRGHA